MRTHHRTDFLWGAIYHLDRHARETIAGSVFDHLQLVPLRRRLFARWWAAMPAVLRHLAPGFKERITVTALAIGRHGRWAVGMPTRLQLGHQGGGDLLLDLGDGPANS